MVKTLERLLDDAVRAGVTPGGQLSLLAPSRGIETHIAFGACSYAHDAPRVTVDTVYDLASLTKVVTALAWVRVADRDGLVLDTPLRELPGAFGGTSAGDATLLSLLSHRAGLLPWAPLYKSVAVEEAGTATARATMLDALASTACTAPGVVRYSDLGYILLGEALSAYTRAPLDEVLRAEVLEPLGLAQRMRYRGVGSTWRDASIAPTERCAWRGRVVQGEVHDENAYALGGVCGHAGLFGTARDLAVLGAASLACLDGDARWFVPERLASMIAPRAGGTHRVGWDARADGNDATPASGSAMGARTFGHLGFTGTSLWCDPDVGVAVALVTNRVHPTRENTGIRALRPAVHDAAMVGLLGRRPKG